MIQAISYNPDFKSRVDVQGNILVVRVFDFEVELWDQGMTLEDFLKVNDYILSDTEKRRCLMFKDRRLCGIDRTYLLKDRTYYLIFITKGRY